VTRRAAAAGDPPPSRAAAWRGALALAALALVIYGPSLPGGFLWDDDRNVFANETLTDAGGLRAIWTDPLANQQYYPLTYTTFWLESQAWGTWPPGFRAVNLLLHALAGVLLWRVLRRLAVPGAWLGAALFVVHPINVESVAWITERRNVLSAVLFFASALAYLRYARIRTDPDPAGRPAGDTRGPLGRGEYALSLLLFALAVLAKTATVTLPAVLAVLLLWKRGRLRRSDLLELAPFFALGLAMGLGTIALEVHHVGAQGAAWQLGPLERVLVAARAFWWYAQKLALPVGLNFIYPRWEVTAAWWPGWVALAALALAAIAAVRARPRIGAGPLVAGTAYALMIGPALGFFDFYFQAYAYVQDHFQYLAGTALLALFAGTGAALAARRPASAGAARAAAAVVLALLAGTSMLRAREFVDEGALWRATLARNPQAHMATINLARWLVAQDRAREAVALEGDAAAMIARDRADLLNNVGLAWQALGEPARAEASYRAALAAVPAHAMAATNLGNLLFAAGRTAEAEALLRAALTAEPGVADRPCNLANLLAATGRAAEAEPLYREALRLDPRKSGAWNNLGRLLAARGDHTGAVAAYERALSGEPGNAAAWHNLGISLEALGRAGDAEAAYRRAIEADPRLAAPCNNLAILLFRRGDVAGARAMLKRFVELGGRPHPDFVAALERGGK
jgi:Flp pilus assembly protein TadD